MTDNLALSPELEEEEKNRRAIDAAEHAASAARSSMPMTDNASDQVPPAPVTTPATDDEAAKPAEMPDGQDAGQETAGEIVQPSGGDEAEDAASSPAVSEPEEIQTEWDSENGWEEGWENREDRRPGEDDWTALRRHNMADIVGELAFIANASAQNETVDRVFRSAYGLGGMGASEVFENFAAWQDRFLDKNDTAAQAAYKATQRAADAVYKQLGGNVEDFWIGGVRKVHDSYDAGVIRDEEDVADYRAWAENQSARAKEIQNKIEFLKQNHNRSTLGRMLWHETGDEDWDNPEFGWRGSSLNEWQKAMSADGITSRGSLKAQQTFDEFEQYINERYLKEKGERSVWQGAADNFRGGLIELGTMGATIGNYLSNSWGGEDFMRRAREIRDMEELGAATTPANREFDEIGGAGDFMGWMFQQFSRLGPQMLAQFGIAIATGGAGNIAAGAAGRAGASLATQQAIRTGAARAGSWASMIALDAADVGSQNASIALENGGWGKYQTAAMLGTLLPFVGFDRFGGLMGGVRRAAGRASGEMLAKEAAKAAQLYTGRGFWKDVLRGGAKFLIDSGTEGATEAGQDWLVRFENAIVSDTMALPGEEKFNLGEAALQSVETFFAAAASGGTGVAASYVNLGRNSSFTGDYWRQKRDFERAVRAADRQMGWQDGTTASLVRSGKAGIDIEGARNGYGEALAEILRDHAIGNAARLDALDATMLGRAIIATQGIHDLESIVRNANDRVERARNGAQIQKVDEKGESTGEFYTVEELMRLAERSEFALQNAKKSLEHYRNNMGDNAKGMLSALSGTLSGVKLEDGARGGASLNDHIRAEGLDKPVSQTADDATDLVTTVYRETDDPDSSHQIQIVETWDPNTNKYRYKVQNLKSDARPADSATEFQSDDFKGDQKAALQAAVDFATKYADWTAATRGMNESFDRAAEAYVAANYPGRKIICASNATEALYKLSEAGIDVDRLRARDQRKVYGLFNGSNESAVTFPGADNSQTFTIVVRERNANPATLASTIDHETLHQDFLAQVQEAMFSTDENGKTVRNDALIRELFDGWVGEDGKPLDLKTPEDLAKISDGMFMQRVRVALLGMDRDGKGRPLSQDAILAAMADDEAQEREEELYTYATESISAQAGSGPLGVLTSIVHPYRAARMRKLYATHPELMKVAGKYVGMKLGAFTRGMAGGVGQDIALGLGASEDEIADYMFRLRESGARAYAPNPHADDEAGARRALEANPVTGEAPAGTPGTPTEAPATEEGKSYSSLEEIEEDLAKAEAQQAAIRKNGSEEALDAINARILDLKRKRVAWRREHPAAPKPAEPKPADTKPEEPTPTPAKPEGGEKPAPEEPAPTEAPDAQREIPKGDGKARVPADGRGKVSMKSPDRSESFDGTVAYMDLGDIVNDQVPGFDMAFQNRGQNDAAREVKAKEIGMNPDADTLTDAGTMIDEGTVVVAKVDGKYMVIAGNTRAWGLQNAHRLGKLGPVVERVRADAEKDGVDLSGMKNPVKVRVLSESYTHEDLEHIAEVSNRQSKNRVPTENLALDDAKKILSGKNLKGRGVSLLDIFSPGPDGQLDNAANRDFMMEFIAETGDNALLGRDKEGRPTEPNAEAYARAQRALVAAVLFGENGDRAETARMLGALMGEGTGMKKLASGIAAAAPALVRAFKANKGFDLSPEMRAALSEIAAARSDGVSLDERFGQATMGFGESEDRTGPNAPALVKDIARALWNRGVGSGKGVSAKAVRELLLDYAERIYRPSRNGTPEWKLPAEEGEGLFGDAIRNTKQSVWNAALAAAMRDDQGLGLRSRNGDSALGAARARNKDDAVQIASHERRQVLADAERKFGKRTIAQVPPNERIQTVFVQGRRALGANGVRPSAALPESAAEVVYRYEGDGRVSVLARLKPEYPGLDSQRYMFGSREADEAAKRRERRSLGRIARRNNGNGRFDGLFQPLLLGPGVRARNGEFSPQTPAFKAQLEAVIARYKGTPQWLKAPNGKDSILAATPDYGPLLWATVRTQSFKDWFGDWEDDPANASKVVDENGEPLLMYHGTPGPEISAFANNQALHAGNRHGGYYFTPALQIAQDYAKMEGNEVGGDQDIDKLFERYYRKQANYNKAWEAVIGPEMVARIKALAKDLAAKSKASSEYPSTAGEFLSSMRGRPHMGDSAYEAMDELARRGVFVRGGFAVEPDEVEYSYGIRLNEDERARLNALADELRAKAGDILARVRADFDASLDLSGTAMPVFLNIRNPLYIDTDKTRAAAVAEFGGEDKFEALENDRAQARVMQRYNRRLLEAGNHDGYFEPDKAPSEMYEIVVPHGYEANIKSIFNSGAFSRTDPRVRARNGVTPAEDAAYMDAVNRGDMETAQRMVREVAARAMPDTKIVDEDGLPLVMYHGSTNKDIKEFDKNRIQDVDYDYFVNGFWFSNDPETSPAFRNAARTYRVFLDVRNPIEYKDAKRTIKEVQSALDKWDGKNETNPLRPSSRSVHDEVRARLQEKGYDGVIVSKPHNITEDMFDENGEYHFIDTNGARRYLKKADAPGWYDLYSKSIGFLADYKGLADFNKAEELVVAAFEPTQPKSADPVTYDDAGNVIPLSERFDMANPDTRARNSVSVAAAGRLGITNEEAERLEREGYFPDEIFRRTRWYRDEEDGEWRYETGRLRINDAALRRALPDWLTVDYLRTKSGDMQNRMIDLGDLLEPDSDILRAYPAARGIHIEFAKGRRDSGTLGSWTESTKTLRFNFNPDLGKTKVYDAFMRNEREGRDTLAHELQHFIQDLEGWRQGGYTGLFSDSYSQMAEDLKDRIDGIMKSLVDIRNDIAGEAARQNLDETGGDAVAAAEGGRRKAPYVTGSFRALSNRAATRMVEKFNADVQAADWIPDGFKRLAQSARDDFVRADNEFRASRTEAGGFYEEAFNKYLRLSGELRARVAGARENLTDEEAAEISPLTMATRGYSNMELGRKLRSGELKTPDGIDPFNTFFGLRDRRAIFDANGRKDPLILVRGFRENEQIVRKGDKIIRRNETAPAGRQKQAGVAYPDASAEIKALDMRSSLGARARNKDAEALLAKYRPDLDAKAVVAELKKFATPKERKIALHWVVRGGLALPEDAYKVADALSTVEQAKRDLGGARETIANAEKTLNAAMENIRLANESGDARKIARAEDRQRRAAARFNDAMALLDHSGGKSLEPFDYKSPDELLLALKEFSPSGRPIDPATVPELSDPRDEGDGIVSYLVQDDRQGQAAMRRIIDTHWGEDANPWCLLAKKKKWTHVELINDYDAYQEMERWWSELPHAERVRIAGGRADEESVMDADPASEYYVDNVVDNPVSLDTAWTYWLQYSALPKRVAFKDGRLLAFMATDGNVSVEPEEAAMPLTEETNEVLHGRWEEYSRLPEETRPRFYDWMRDEHSDEFDEIVERENDGGESIYFYDATTEIPVEQEINEEWWDRRDVSHPDLDWARDENMEPGARARNIDETGAMRLGLGNADEARRMEREGASRLAIWRATGWWKRPVDGMWRIELPPLKFKPGAFERLDAAIRAGGGHALKAPKFSPQNLPTRADYDAAPASVKSTIRSLLLQDAVTFAAAGVYHDYREAHSKTNPKIVHESWYDRRSFTDRNGVEHEYASIGYGEDDIRKYLRNAADEWMSSHGEQAEILGGMSSEIVPDALRMFDRFVRDILTPQGEKSKVRLGLARIQAADRPMTLGEILTDDDPVLRALPRLRNFPIRFISDTGRYGGWASDTEIVLNTAWTRGESGARKTAETLAHEIQHEIQSIVGFDEGGSIESDRAQARVDDELRKIRAENELQGLHLSERKMRDMAEKAAYMGLGGEVEARAVEARMSLTDEQRKEIPPWVTEEVVRNDLFTERSDYSYAAQKRMMEQMDADERGVQTSPLTITPLTVRPVEAPEQTESRPIGRPEQLTFDFIPPPNATSEERDALAQESVSDAMGLVGPRARNGEFATAPEDIGRRVMGYNVGDRPPDITPVEVTNSRTGKPERAIAFPGDRPEGYVPSRIGYAYKLMEQWPDGSLHALFANVADTVPQNEWMFAAGFPLTDRNVKGMKLRQRYAWHLGFGLPTAPHLMSSKDYDRGYPTGAENGKGHPKGSRRVWVRVAFDASNDWNAAMDRVSGREGGDPYGLIPFGGYYGFIEGNKSNWILSSAVKFDKVLSEDERQEILRGAGFDERAAWEQRHGGKKLGAKASKPADKLAALRELRDRIARSVVDNPEQAAPGARARNDEEAIAAFNALPPYPEIEEHRANRGAAETEEDLNAEFDRWYAALEARNAALEQWVAAAPDFLVFSEKGVAKPDPNGGVYGSLLAWIVSPDKWYEGNQHSRPWRVTSVYRTGRVSKDGYEELVPSGHSFYNTKKDAVFSIGQVIDGTAEYAPGIRARNGLSFYADELFPEGGASGEGGPISFRQVDILRRMRGLVPGYDYKPEHIEEVEYVRLGMEKMERDPEAVRALETEVVGQQRPRPLAPDEQYVLYAMQYDAERVLRRAIDIRSKLEKTRGLEGQLAAARAMEEAAEARALELALAANRVGSALGRALAFRQVAYRWNKILTYDGLVRSFNRALARTVKDMGGIGIAIDPNAMKLSEEDRAFIKQLFEQVVAIQRAVEEARTNATAASALKDLQAVMASLQRYMRNALKPPLGSRTAKPKPVMGEEDFMRMMSRMADEEFALEASRGMLDPRKRANWARATNIVKLIGNWIIARDIQQGREQRAALDFRSELYDRCDAVLGKYVQLSAREYGEIFSDYGVVREASKNELFVRRTKLNGALRLLSQIAAIQRGDAPRRTGQQRVEGTDEQTDLERRLHALIKELDPEAEKMLDRGEDADKPEKFIKTPLQIWRDAALKEIRMLEGAIESGVPLERNRLKLRLGEEELSIQELLRQRREEYREVFENPKTDEERIEAYIKTLERRRDALAQELADAQRGVFKHRGEEAKAFREKAEKDARVAAIREELDDLRERIQNERDTQGDSLSTYNKRVKAVLGGIQRSIENAIAWTNDPDLYFERERKRRQTHDEIEADPRVKEARAKQREFLDKWEEERDKRAFAKLNALGKTRAAMGGAFDAVKLFLASGDLSILGVQCAIPGLADPRTAAKAVWAGALAAFAKESTVKDWENGRLGDRNDKIARALKTFDELVTNNPFFREAADEFGVHFSSVDNQGGYEQTEEGFAKSYTLRRAMKFLKDNGGPLGKFASGYLAGSERAFTIPADIIRITLCKHISDAAVAAHGPLTADEKRYIGRVVNAVSGRGDFFGHNSWSATLSKFMWAPARFSGQLQTLALPFTLWAHKEVSNPIKLAIAKNLFVPVVVKYAIAVGLAAVLRALLGFGDGDDDDDDGPLMELDPRSAKFGRINIGGRMFSLTGGLESYITLGARMATGQSKTRYGDIQTLEQQRTSRTDLIWRNLRSKAVPHLGLVAQLMDGRAITGEKIESNWLGENGRLSFILGNTIFPLTINDVARVAFGGEHHANAAERLFLSGIAVLGYNANDFGYNSYEAHAHRFDRAHRALRDAKTAAERERVMKSELGPYAAQDARGEALRHERRQIDVALRTERDPNRRAALLARKDRNEIRFLALWREGLREEADSWTPDMDEALKRASREIDRMPEVDNAPRPVNYW